MKNTKAVYETWGLFNHIFTEGAFQKEKTLSHSSLTNRKVARYWSLGQNPALFEKGLESSLNVSPMMLGQAQDIRIKPIANSQSSQLLEHYIPCQTMSKYSLCLHQLTMVPMMFAYGSTTSPELDCHLCKCLFDLFPLALQVATEFQQSTVGHLRHWSVSLGNNPLR